MELKFIIDYQYFVPPQTKRANLVTQLVAEKVKKELKKEFRELLKKEFNTTNHSKQAEKVDDIDVAQIKQEECKDNNLYYL